MSGLGTVLERLQSLFGKGYLVAGFLPALVGFGITLLLSLWVFPGVRALTVAFDALQAEDQAVGWLTLVFALGVVGFVLWSLNPWLHLLLQGRALPDFLQDLLKAGPRAELKALQNDLQRADREVFDFRDEQERWKAALQNALATPAGATRAAAPPPAFKEAQRQVRGRAVHAKVWSFAEANKLFQQVENALKESPLLPEVYGLQEEFLVLAGQFLERAESEQQRLHTRRTTEFPLREADLQPTRMANAWQADSDYPWVRYGMSIEIFWPHLQKLMQGETASYVLLAESQIKLAFATAMTSVFGLLFLIWWPIALFRASTLAMYIAVGALLAASALFYWVTAFASRGYGAAVRSAVDLYRFDLLTSLHLPLPADSKAERDLWLALTAQSELVSAPTINYRDSDGTPDKNLGNPPAPGLLRRLLAAFRG